MIQLSRPTLVACVAALGLALAASAQPKPAAPKGRTYLDPEQAGPDYAVQGEYLGKLADGAVLGVQVAARGEGNFDAFVLAGGLPGAGWDTKPPVALKGKTVDGQTPLTGGGWTATIRDGKLSGTTDKGAAFTLDKTVRVSPTLGAKPPAGALVLFDGTNLDAWAKGKMDDRKLLAAQSGPTTKGAWSAFTLHLELLQPFKPDARSQARGNSGVYLQQRYEVQVLDSFGTYNPPPLHGEVAGDLYRTVDAKLNASLPPLVWQTYDIDFVAPTFEGGKRVKKGRLTVKVNGITVQDDIEIPNKTGAGKPEGPDPLPLYLQDHGNPVFYRNVWLVDKSKAVNR